ncbi:MAG: NADH-quinone oxidoreductase subunit L [Phycisphaerales bacterium]|nr:NADH-quinone oxidoreductase subunit L [Phycisphaerales bacterium]
MEIAGAGTLGVLILLLPALGAVAAAALGPRVLKGNSHLPVIFGVGGAAVVALIMLKRVAGVGPEALSTPVIYEWFSAKQGSWFNVELWIDPLTALMMAMVTFVATFVVVYSKEYMRHHDHPERGYERFFAFLGMFVCAMGVLVLGGNFLLLYMGWEAVGLCSYLLIGFYYEKPSAAAAAKKAFLVNRIGDFGFGLGILLIYMTFGHLDYRTVFEAIRLTNAHNADALMSLLNLGSLTEAQELIHTIAARLPYMALLLLCGAIGKSAQFPLYVWLPDAMEGPSPVSALIHAATMVTAGVYMMVRCGLIFAASDTVMLIIAIIGGGTALFAATVALVQTDMKRILAYSTISQLGYMFLGVGVFAASSAIFHLFTHAFFKALLFLGAGSVMHAMGGVIDVRRFGGLKRIMPITFVTMLIGSLALAGFPLFAGFWSKDEIVHHAMMHRPILGIVGLITAALTAFYTFRMMFLAFWGEERVPEGVHAHESGRWILVPLCVLALGAAFAGYVGVHVESGGFLGFLQPDEDMAHPQTAIHHFLSEVTAPFHVEHGAEHVVAAGHAAMGAEHAMATEHVADAVHGGFLAAIAHHWLMYVSALIAIGGILVAYWWYVRKPWIPQLLRSMLPDAYNVLLNKYFVDEGYDKAIVKPLRMGGVTCFRLDEFFIDGVIWLITAIPRFIGFCARSLQGGALQGYGLTMAAGLGIIVVLALLM